MLAQFTKLKYDHFFPRRQLLLIKWNFWANSDEPAFSYESAITLILGLDGDRGWGGGKTNSCL